MTSFVLPQSYHTQWEELVVAGDLDAIKQFDATAPVPNISQEADLLIKLEIAGQLCKENGLTFDPHSPNVETDAVYIGLFQLWQTLWRLSIGKHGLTSPITFWLAGRLSDFPFSGVRVYTEFQSA